MNAAMIGEWFAAKWRTRAEKTSVFHAAKQMQKQGIPIHITVATLARR